MLCKSCVRALIDAPQDLSGALSFQSSTNAVWSHHESFSEFKAAAALQCVVCARLWSYRFTLQQSLDPSFHPLIYETTGNDQSSSTQSLRQKTWASKPGDLPVPDQVRAFIEFKDGVRVDNARIAYSLISGGSLHLNIYWGEAGGINRGYDYRFDSTFTGSPESIAFMKFQLTHCDTNHDCFSEETESYRPTRLLDISGAVGEGGTVRLVTSADVPIRGPYVALSYCWGRNNTITFNKESATALRQGIKQSILPQTFQDAISICLHLEVEYLWIDALCISQDPDDLSDWKKEAALMSEVYMQAYFTIVASVSADCHEGLFRARNPQVLRTEHEFEHKSELAELAEKEPLVTISAYDDIDLWQAEILQTPVGARGWTVQERILSKRKIFFGARQVLWECDELQACEAQPFGHPDAAKRYDEQFRSCLKSLHMECEFPMRDQQMFWDTITQQYSRCNLTRRTDKLVALSGVARAMGAATGDQYIAGMWKRFIGSAILQWHRIDFDLWNRNGEYVAPTFSWASSDGVTKFSVLPVHNPSIFLVDFSIEATPDEYGAVTTGYIRVQSFLKTLTLTMHDQLPSARHPWTLRPGTLSPIEIDCLTDHIEGPQMIGMVQFFFDFDPRKLDCQDEETRTAKIYYTGPRISEDREVLITPFLLLVHKNAGTFERVGIMQWSLDFEDEESLVVKGRTETGLWSMDSQFAGEDEIPCENYNSEKHLHTYCIK